MLRSLDQFAKERAEEASEGTSVNNTSNWKALTSILHADTQDELVTLLGFCEDTANKVSEAIERLKVTIVPSPTTGEEPVAGGVREPLLSQTKHLRPKQSRLSPLHQSRV